jgi:hypothetical protein
VGSEGKVDKERLRYVQVRREGRTRERKSRGTRRRGRPNTVGIELKKEEEWMEESGGRGGGRCALITECKRLLVGE